MSGKGSLFWRTASGLVAGPLFLVLVYLGGWPLRLLAAALAALGLREYFALGLAGGEGAGRGDRVLKAVAFALLIVFFLPGTSVSALPWLAAGSLLLLAAAGLFRAGSAAAGMGQEAARVFFGLWYIGGGFFYLPALRATGAGLTHLLVAVLATWAVDVAAYFVGTAAGRHKLALKVSPGKTVEGALGGLLGGVIVAAAGGRFFGVPLLTALGMGLAVGVAAQLGDLVESALKRSVGAKDSGRFLPGHGGLLDRFDSLLFVLPVVYWFWRI